MHRPERADISLFRTLEDNPPLQKPLQLGQEFAERTRISRWRFGRYYADVGGTLAALRFAHSPLAAVDSRGAVQIIRLGTSLDCFLGFKASVLQRFRACHRVDQILYGGFTIARPVVQIFVGRWNLNALQGQLFGSLCAGFADVPLPFLARIIVLGPEINIDLGIVRQEAGSSQQEAGSQRAVARAPRCNQGAELAACK